MTNRMPKLYGLIAAVTVTGLVAACGGGSPTASPPTHTPTGAEVEYLERVTAAAKVSQEERFGPVDEALNTTWPTRERLLSTLREADIEGSQERAVQRFEQLVPPEQYREDHERWLTFLRDESRDSGVMQAVDNEDLVALVVAQVQGRLESRRVFARLSPGFCRALARDLMGQLIPRAFCGDGEPLPGGDYGPSSLGFSNSLWSSSDPVWGPFPCPP